MSYDAISVKSTIKDNSNIFYNENMTASPSINQNSQEISLHPIHQELHEDHFKNITDIENLYQESTVFPDVSRLLGCINQVLKLSQYTSLNYSPNEKIPLNEIIAVIPAFNEELTIGMVILLSLQHVNRVIVVNDGSTDRTSEIAQLAGAEVINLKKKVGRANAVLSGLAKAHEIGFKTIVVIDANGLYNPHEIPYLTTLISEGEADVVIGSRFLRNPNIVSSYIFTGKQPGFIAFNEKAIKILCNNNRKSIFEDNILNLRSINDLKVADIPVTVRKKEISQNSIEKLIIALPAFNEEKNISSVVKGALKYSNTVVVVDDGSTDNTAIIAEETGAIVVKHGKNQGYGAALNTIFNTARSMDADALVIIDSDGQHNPSDIKCLVEKLKTGADVVIGSRFLEINNTIPMYRQVGMKILDLFTTAAGVNKITDSQSGFRAYGRKALAVMSISGKGMSAGSEILIKISDYNLKVSEVPITVRYDIEDTSTHNPVYHGFSVLSNILALINFKNPIIFVGIPASVLIIIGLIAVYFAMFMGESFALSKIYLVLISETFLFTGLIFACEGYIFHFFINKAKNH
jgi:glycosyltransferase involved in cell wall biosynthesis